MNIASKHHYLPQFYLKGFTNDSGKFSIFDVEKGHIKKGEYSTSTHFFETNKNTIEFKGKKSDFPEVFYSLKENRYAKVLQIIQACKGVPILDQLQMFTIQEFVSNIFWRLPKNDSLYSDEFRSNPLFTKSFKFVNKESGEEFSNDYTEEIRNSQALETGMRENASTLSFMLNSKTDLDNWRISYIPKDYHLCSDNPLILNNCNVKDVFDSEFIFPLTKNHLLIRTYKSITKPILTPRFGFMTDMAVFLQGEKYCASPTRDFLNAVYIDSKNYKIELLRKSIFEMMHEFY